MILISRLIKHSFIGGITLIQELLKDWLTVCNRGLLAGDSLDRVVRNSVGFGLDDVADGDGGEDDDEGEWTEIKSFLQVKPIFDMLMIFKTYLNLNYNIFI